MSLAQKFPLSRAAVYVERCRISAFPIEVIQSSPSAYLATLTLRTRHLHVAEEAAIALALTQRPIPEIIFSDSKMAVQNFAKGLFSAQAHKILCLNSPSNTLELQWFPAHTGIGEVKQHYCLSRRKLAPVHSSLCLDEEHL